MAEQFGSYILLEKVAEGGMAELYLAKSSKVSGIEKYLVIKRILPKFSGSRELINLFINEAKINMNMSHSNIVSIFDFGITDGRFYIAMEYVQGVNLRHLIIDQNKEENDELKLKEEEMLFIISQAAKGLSYAHRCKEISTGLPLNIIHRDVSPDNIMIDLETNIKIIDFGVAVDFKNTDRSTQEGKFSYMSPEQAKGEKLDPRTDIFSLGIILWELLAERRLYTGTSKEDLLDKVKNCHIQHLRIINPDIPNELASVVHKALAPTVAERYQTMEEFHVALNSYLYKNFPSFSTEGIREKVQSSFGKRSDFMLKTMTQHEADYNTEVDYQGSVTSFFNGNDKTMVTGAGVNPKKGRLIKARRIVKRRKKVKKAS